MFAKINTFYEKLVNKANKVVKYIPQHITIVHLQPNFVLDTGNYMLHNINYSTYISLHFNSKDRQKVNIVCSSLTQYPVLRTADSASHDMP